MSVMKVLRQTLLKYQTVLTKHPYKVQSIQTSVLMLTGDVMAQRFVEKKKLGLGSVEKVSEDRTSVRLLRFPMMGPVLQYWYTILERIGGTNGRAITVVKKVLIDQIIAAPLMLAIVITTITLLFGQDLAGVRAKFRQDYLAVLITNYKVWPFVQLANFYLVPLQYRVLLVQTVAIFWNTYLSTKANRPIDGSTLPLKKGF
uniref:Mitochondrial inner membrane protein Mpv17 n=1 Tax=Timema bartmani TaxID=61472 RepID=A0A7R9F2Y5_9NEOP|nr:unnamed protein product [Timema bartmani]